MINPITVAILSGIASLLRFNIGDGGLRISLGIIVMIVALYSYRQLNVWTTSILTGIVVFLVRVLVSYAGAGHFDASLLNYALEIVFYIAYGALFNLMVLHDTSVYKSPLVLLLMLCDFGANSVEYLIRYMFVDASLVTMDFLTIFLAAFARSAIIWMIIHFIIKPGDPTRTKNA